jgi:hypothetical protein
MALIITPTEEKKIHVQGTTIELQSVYNRIEFGCRPNGKTIEMAFYTYADRASYEAGLYLPTDLPIGNLTQDIDPLTQTQSVEAAHELAKTWYEEQGYIVTIDLQ